MYNKCFFIKVYNRKYHKSNQADNNNKMRSWVYMVLGALLWAASFTLRVKKNGHVRKININICITTHKCVLASCNR